MTRDKEEGLYFTLFELRNVYEKKLAPLDVIQKSQAVYQVAEEEEEKGTIMITYTKPPISINTSNDSIEELSNKRTTRASASKKSSIFFFLLYL